MKIPLTKPDVPPTKQDVPLPFKKMKSTGQYIISCEDSLFIKGSPAKSQDHPPRQQQKTMDLSFHHLQQTLDSGFGRVEPYIN